MRLSFSSPSPFLPFVSACPRIPCVCVCWLVSTNNTTHSSKLLGFICELVESSQTVQQHMIQVSRHTCRNKKRKRKKKTKKVDALKHWIQRHEATWDVATQDTSRNLSLGNPFEFLHSHNLCAHFHCFPICRIVAFWWYHSCYNVRHVTT